MKLLLFLSWLTAACAAGAAIEMSAAEDRQLYPTLFERAGREFNVPADVLKGIAFAETRWAHLTWPAGETISPCNGMPRPYGIMSLWENEWFGHSLTVAAALIGQSPDVLKTNIAQNIRGAAALLRKLHDELPLPAGTTRCDLESWGNAIAAYCGIPQPELAHQHALEVFAHIQRGYHQHGIEWPGREVNLTPIREAVKRAKGMTKTGKRESGRAAEGGVNFQPAAQPDYPGAIWRPAYPGHWYTTGVGRYFVVIHDMEGYYLSTISYFQQSGTQASIHYCVNGLADYVGDAAPGEITQMVEERYWAWHARCWNPYMLGIEHEGFVNNPAWYTEAQYQASANLTRYLCDKYGIPKDRNHIIAHGQKLVPGWTTWMTANWPQIDSTCNDHTDPGANWDWTHYMTLVVGPLPPAITMQPTNLVKNAGSTASFSVVASGAAPMSYRWQKNGAPLSNGGNISGATSANLNIADIQFSDASFYSVVVSNTSGITLSQQAQLNIATVAAPIGTGTGLRALVFDNADFTSMKRARIDATVNFDWTTNSPSSTTDPDTFSIRWLGQVQPRYSQTYAFHTTTDDGVRLWVNGVLLIDKWQDQGAAEWTGNIALNAGQKYDLRMDYYENSGAASAQLRWSSPSQVKEIVPATQLYRPPPVFQPPGNVSSTAGTTLSFALLVTNCDAWLSSQPLADFNEYADGQNDVMFRQPAYSGSTAQFIDPAETNYTAVVAASPPGNSSARSLKARWAFAAGAAAPWLRLTTANTPNLPNPAIDFTQSLWFDINPDRPVRVALGVRETGTTNTIGSDGGQNGSIEFIGVTGVTNGQPFPSRLITANTWTTLAFDLAREPVRRFTGDGVLSSTNSRGALEHLAIIPDAGPGIYRVHVDNFLLVADNRLTYSLEPGAPAGAAVNASSGLFSWPVPASQTPGAYPISVRVTDSGTPSMSATQSVTVAIAATPRMTIAAGANGIVTLSWNSLAAQAYRVQFKDTLGAATWQNLADVVAVSGTATFQDTPGVAQRFYRILVL